MCNMILKSYKKEISRPKCNPGFQTVNCLARLDQDIEEVLPYINARLGGFEYFKDPPQVIFNVDGKTIAVHPREIVIHALKDAEEADKILEWIKREINETWEKKGDIEPKYEGMPKPKVFDILKMLPMSNCRKCGLPTCMVFATQIAGGIKAPDDCPELDEQKRRDLSEYLTHFKFDF